MMSSTEENETESTLQDPADKPVIRAKGALSAAIAWLALLFSVLAIAMVALDYLRDRGEADIAAADAAALQTLAASVGATRDMISSLEQSLASATEANAARDSRIDALGQQLNDRLRELESLPGRIAAVEATTASLQGISRSARDAWLLAEAEYYLQIANVQLQLASNPELAILALEHADERVIQLADPRLTSVRQALADELRALRGLQRPDTAGMTLTLASLARVIESLPLRQTIVADDRPEAEIDPELSGWNRAMASLRRAADSVVTVRRTDEKIQPLVAPEAQYFLRANLELQLQAARLALLRGNESVYQQSLEDADSWLAEFYDPASTAVESCRETITELRNSVISVSPPDISLSLRLLRQFKTLAETVERNEAEQPQ